MNKPNRNTPNRKRSDVRSPASDFRSRTSDLGNPTSDLGPPISEIIDLIRSLFEQPEGTIPLHAPIFNGNERKYVLDAIDSTFVSSVGKYVDRFEEMLTDITGAEYAVATVNGTAALQVALQLAGVQSGDEVMTQPLTFVATCNAISHCGAKPAFVDIDSETVGLSPNSLENFLQKHCKFQDGNTINRNTGNRIAACVPMHTFGHPCRIEEICKVCDRYNIPVVEDAAEALGSTRNGKQAGTFGKLGIYSFNGNKTVTCGGGGAIVTNDESLAKHAKHITTTAKVPHPYEYVHDEVAYNYRMPNLNAALACAQLEMLDTYIANKRRTAKAYADFFDAFESIDFLKEPENCHSNYWLNSLVFESKAVRDKFLKQMNDNRIMARAAWRLMPDLEIFRNCQNDNLQTAQTLQPCLANIPSSVNEKQ